MTTKLKTSGKTADWSMDILRFFGRHPLGLAASISTILIVVLIQPYLSPKTVRSPFSPSPTAEGLTGDARQVGNVPSRVSNPMSAPSIFVSLSRHDRFDPLVQNGLYSDQLTYLDSDIHQAFEYVSKQFTVRNPSRFKAAFVIGENCVLHGITRPDEGVAQVYTCNNIPRSKAIGIMAHELAHQLQFEQYEAAHLNADLLLTEGMATWAAGKYWVGEHADFRSYVNASSASEPLVPLSTPVGREDYVKMNKLYYQWASFVEFLIETYGRDKFDQLYVTGNLTVGSAAYTQVYGKDLQELERDWRFWIGN